MNVVGELVRNFFLLSVERLSKIRMQGPNTERNQF